MEVKIKHRELTKQQWINARKNPKPLAILKETLVLDHTNFGLTFHVMWKSPPKT
ncbi:hypothetical protein COO91_06246 [Nostoc flagelliforme CCNUN1]|uniref:Uncharacterized protein n=1 Tax=Nostoc flagelliforme CCNUN1 TaxID=2038116 RepID=A0A2K8SXR9_9NOSO|nr:hypothetical protein COO91_06246 [Nostoc flagelliforme CCNUN1]